MSRDDLTLVSLWVHVPFITAWIGLVMLDGFAAFAPGLNPGQRLAVIRWSRPFVLVGIPVILITGTWQTMENPFVEVNSWSTLQLLKERTLYGDLLFWKHVFVVATFGLTIISRFILPPRVENMAVMTGGPGVAVAGTAGGAWQLLRLSVVANLAACLGVLLLATRMVVELH